MVTGKLSNADYEARILANVQEFGCHITTVADPDGGTPSFSYSTGFTRSVGQGEVIIFGLPSQLTGFMINETLSFCRDGLQLDDGVQIGGLLQGFDVVARTVHPASIVREHFNSAMWFHRREFGTDLDAAFQLVWPGALDGLYPWDEGASSEVREAQPPLYERGAIH